MMHKAKGSNADGGEDNNSACITRRFAGLARRSRAEPMEWKEQRRVSNTELESGRGMYSVLM
jgi:hypothetical protein